MATITTEPQQGYWDELDRQIKVSNALDRRAARLTNAEFELVNAVPFGTPRRSLP